MKTLTELLIEQLGVEEDKVVPEASLVDDLQADELDMVEICMEIEDVFDIEVSDEDMNAWKTVGDINQYLESKGAKT